LNLSKLTRAQSGAMVSRLAGTKALAPDLLEQILAKTDGVPLFVEELTKSILESGEVKEAGDHYEYTGAAHTVSIPATLRDSLMARLDRVMRVKEIAQIGAAIGREFSYELISAVAPMSKAALDDGLERLTESGLAFRRGAPSEATYTFKHALVQDAAYDSLLKIRRQELHAKIARVVEERFPSIKSTEPKVLPSRPALFETLVVNEFLEVRCHQGLRSNLHFRRDNVGNEIDLLLEQGSELVAVEITSGQTLTTDTFTGLRRWSAIAGPQAARLHLVFGGDQSFETEGLQAHSWRDV